LRDDKRAWRPPRGDDAWSFQGFCEDGTVGGGEVVVDGGLEGIWSRQGFWDCIDGRLSPPSLPMPKPGTDTPAVLRRPMAVLLR